MLNHARAKGIEKRDKGLKRHHRRKKKEATKQRKYINYGGNSSANDTSS